MFSWTFFQSLSSLFKQSGWYILVLSFPVSFLPAFPFLFHSFMYFSFELPSSWEFYCRQVATNKFFYFSQMCCLSALGLHFSSPKINHISRYVRIKERHCDWFFIQLNSTTAILSRCYKPLHSPEETWDGCSIQIIFPIH